MSTLKEKLLNFLSKYDEVQAIEFLYHDWESQGEGGSIYVYMPPKYSMTEQIINEISSIYNPIDDEDVEGYRLVCPVNYGSPDGTYVLKRGVDF